MSQPADSSISLYIHIPYCAKKCGYCDFNSYAGAREGEMEAYVAALEREMELWAARLADPAGPLNGAPYQVPTCFVGGGTPTLLPGELLARVIRRARALFPFAADAEITTEANPGTVDVDGDKLALVRAAGANRISFGVQAFQDRVLRSLDRFHGVEEVYQAVAAARAAGFANLNLDLMYGLPGQTIDDFAASLREAVSLGPEHISAYSLIVEEGTPFYVLHQRGQLELPPEEAEDQMDAMARQVLAAAGYECYEVSNYARPGRRCRHNLVYWRNGQWLGLGAGAHSHLHAAVPLPAHAAVSGGADGAAPAGAPATRFWNHKLPATYIRLLTQDQLPVEGGETVPEAEQMAETMMLGLRLLDGVSEQAFARRFGRTLEQVYGPVGARLESQGLLERQDGSWRLTPRGLRLGNRVWAEFLPG